MADEPPTRPEALIAYSLSAATTLQWIGCVLPAGPLAIEQATGQRCGHVDAPRAGSARARTAAPPEGGVGVLLTTTLALYS